MKTKFNNQESGSVIFTILFVLLMVVIAVLLYLLLGGKAQEKNNTIGVTSPVQSITSTKTEEDGIFSDGLKNPSFSETYKLDDFGTGISSKEIFDYDINNDGKKDRITKTKYENGNAHFYYEYKIEINQNGEFIDITPNGFRTTEGAECALQKLKFIFKPDFRVIKISRDWKDSWSTPTMAQETIFSLSNNSLNPVSTKNLKEICDVSELF